MKSKKVKHLLLLLILLVLTTTLYGCKGGNNNKEENSNTDNISSLEPTYGGEIVVGISQDFDSLDPHKAVAAGTKEVLFNLYEGLVKPDKDGNLIPAVASNYEVSQGGKVYTFTLRDGITFHNGELVTVEDIKYSILRCAGLLEKTDPSVLVEQALSNILEVNIVDEKNVEVVLKQADTEILGYFTFAIVPEDYKELDTKPMGTGPFCFVSYSPLESMVVKKYEGYNGISKPYLDQVTFKIVANTDTAFMELKAGGIDIFPYLTDDQANQLSNDFNIAEGNMNLVQALFFNNKVEPFNNPDVRKALNYAIDKQQILDMVAGGRGKIIGTNMFPGFTKYYNSDLDSYYNVDVAKAKELLAEAGYPNGFEFSITVPSNYQYHMDTAQVIVEQLKAIGVTAKIDSVEWATWLSKVYNDRDYQATIVGLAAEMTVRKALERFQTTGDKNFQNYSNPDFDSVYEQAVKTTDENKKIDLYKKAQEMLTEDAISVYLQDPPLLVAVNKKLGGYTFYPVYVQDMSTIYYKK